MRDMETDYHWNTRCFDCGREWKYDGQAVPYRCDCGSANIRSTRNAPAREDKAMGPRRCIHCDDTTGHAGDVCDECDQNLYDADDAR